jgi:nucleotide sugar dehydrogenase
MRVVVVGLGYVGSVCSACLASRGHSVVGVDTSEYKTGCLQRGESPIVEAGLGELIAGSRAAGRLSATTRIAEALPGAEAVLVCVGTPSGADGSLDLSHVRRAVEEVGRALRSTGTYTVVVMRSTMLPGSVKGELTPILEAASGLVAGRDFGVAYNPEFLREGTAIRDFFEAEFTVIGTDEERSAAVLRRLYEGIGGAAVVMPLRASEIMKYVNNSYHALKVVFANEVGRICKREGIDSHLVMDLFVRDTRLNLSAYYFKPGFAYGGSCLPKDVRALQQRARVLGAEVPVIEAISRSNDLHVDEAIRLVERLKRRRVGVLGLSFKAGTDDLRESPTPARDRHAGRQGLQRAAARPQRGHGARAGREPPLRRGRGPVPARAAAPRPGRGPARQRGRGRGERRARVPRRRRPAPARPGARGPRACRGPGHRHPRGVPWPRLVASCTSPRTCRCPSTAASGWS